MYETALLFSPSRMQSSFTHLLSRTVLKLMLLYLHLYCFTLLVYCTYFVNLYEQNCCTLLLYVIVLLNCTVPVLLNNTCVMYLYCLKSSLVKPLSWMIFICLTMVLLPDSPAPKHKSNLLSSKRKSHITSQLPV